MSTGIDGLMGFIFKIFPTHIDVLNLQICVCVNIEPCIIDGREVDNVDFDSRCRIHLLFGDNLDNNLSHRIDHMCTIYQGEFIVHIHIHTYTYLNRNNGKFGLL